MFSFQSYAKKIDFDLFSSKSCLGVFANINFVILFPISFFYYYYSSQGILPVLPFKLQRLVPLVISVLLFIGLWLLWINCKKRLEICFPLTCICLLYVCGATIVGIFYFKGQTDVGGESICAFQVKVAFLYLIFFSTGCFLLNNVSRHNIALGFFVLMLGCIILHLDTSRLSIKLVADNKTYLFLGDAFAIWALWTLATASRKYMVEIFFAGVFGVAMLVTRTALIAYVSAGLLCLLYACVFNRRFLSWGFATILTILLLWLGGHLAKWQILRGYQSKSFSDTKGWSVFWKGPGKMESFQIDDKKGVLFYGSSETGYQFWLTPPHVKLLHFSCQFRQFDNFQIIIACNTAFGNRRMIYTYESEDKQEKLLIDSKRKFLIRKMPNWPVHSWGILQRNIESDLRDFEPKNQLFTVLAVLIHGKGALANMVLYKETPEKDSWSHENLSFFYRNFRQYEDRYYLIKSQLFDLRKHWLWGDFAGQIRHGGLAYYMHNWLSFWQQYGLIPFLLFCGLFFWQYAIIGREYFRDFLRNVVIEIRKIKARIKFGFRKKRGLRYERLKADNPILLATFLLATFNLIEVTFARSYATPYIWLSMGMMPAYLIYRKQKLFSSFNNKQYVWNSRNN